MVIPHPPLIIPTVGRGREQEVQSTIDAYRTAAKQVVDTYIRCLAAGVTNVINIFQPDVLCIGGGIGCEGEPLLAPLRAYAEKERYSIHCGKQTQICSAVLGNDAGVIGAALLDE